MAASWSSSGSNYPEQTFTKTITPSDIANGTLWFEINDFHPVISQYMSPGMRNTLNNGQEVAVVVVDMSTGLPFTAELQKVGNYHIVMSEIGDLINAGIFVTGYEVAFSWYCNTLRVHRY